MQTKKLCITERGIHFSSNTVIISIDDYVSIALERATLSVIVKQFELGVLPSVIQREI